LGSSGNRKRRIVPLYNPPSSRYKFSMAASMRKNPTAAEQAMWGILTKQLGEKGQNITKRRHLPKSRNIGE